MSLQYSPAFLSTITSAISPTSQAAITHLSASSHAPLIEALKQYPHETPDKPEYTRTGKDDQVLKRTKRDKYGTKRDKTVYCVGYANQAF